MEDKKKELLTTKDILKETLDSISPYIWNKLGMDGECLVKAIEQAIQSKDNEWKEKIKKEIGYCKRNPAGKGTANKYLRMGYLQALNFISSTKKD